MKLYTVELTTPKLEHVVTIDVEAGSFGGAERAARKLYDWAKPITVKAVRLNEDPTADYGSKLQYIPLTGEQKSLLNWCRCRRKRSSENAKGPRPGT